MVKGLSNRIATTREERGMSASDLARLLGVTPTAVWNWEKNAVTPRPETLTSIAQILGVSEAFLLTGASGEAVKKAVNTVPEVIEGAQRQIAAITGMPVDRVRVRVEFE